MTRNRRYRVFSVFSIALALSVTACNRITQQSVDRMNQEQIRLTLDKQTHAWNAGDIDRFMQDYVQSNELTFISDGSIQRGWNATYERYKRRYPDKSTMGTVTFSDTEVYMLNDENAFVIGKWHVGREVNPIGGRYTLVMQKRDNRWVIIHDHTSTAREALSPSE